jgi:excinuclease UvrABC helicase subunit UvrB
LLERPDVIIVATVSAIYGIGDPGDYHQMILHLCEGEKKAQRDIITRLTTMQYERNELEFKRGVFRVKGDVIDIFPAENAELALRISLFDDEIESLALFDPLTGHVKQTGRALYRIPVQPLRYPACHRAARHRDHQGRVDRAAGLLPQGNETGRGAAAGAAHPFRSGNAQ